MVTAIYVRNLPDAVHSELSRRARSRRLTLTAYVRGILECEVEGIAVVDALIERLRAAPRVPLGDAGVEAIHAYREELDEKWDRLFARRSWRHADSGEAPSPPR